MEWPGGWDPAGQPDAHARRGREDGGGGWSGAVGGILRASLMPTQGEGGRMAEEGGVARWVGWEGRMRWESGGDGWDELWRGGRTW